MSVVFAGYVDAFAPPSQRKAARSEDDEVTIARAKAGDPAAFDALHTRYENAIYNYLYRLRGDADAARDLTQDTFLKAYLALPHTRDDLRFGAWVYRIATNVFLDDTRHRKLVQWDRWDAFVAVFHPAQVAPDSPERDAIRGEDAEEVREILERLPDKYRAVLEMREFREFSYDEIARELVTTRAAVKSLLLRARDEFVRLYNNTARRSAVSARPGRSEGARLSARRKELGLTQKDLAAMLGCNHGRLAQLEARNVGDHEFRRRAWAAVGEYARGVAEGAS